MFTIELGIFSFNSYVYYLTRAFNLPTRSFNLATRAFSLLTRGFELVTRGFELVTCRLELVTREFELVTRRFELVTRVLLFHLVMCSLNVRLLSILTPNNTYSLLAFCIRSHYFYLSVYEWA